MNCLTTIPIGSVLLTSDHLNIDQIYRTLDYYIDPLSTEIIELGTYKYPYKSIKSVISEIINFHSHVHRDIVIYTKDAYIEDELFHIINITSVTITSHPDYLEIGRRAILIPTSVPQPNTYNKTQFHLLK